MQATCISVGVLIDMLFKADWICAEIPRDEKDTIRSGIEGGIVWELEDFVSRPKEPSRSPTMKSEWVSQWSSFTSSGSLCIDSSVFRSTSCSESELLDPSELSGEDSEWERRLFFLEGPSWCSGWSARLCLRCGLIGMESEHSKNRLEKLKLSGRVLMYTWHLRPQAQTWKVLVSASWTWLGFSKSNSLFEARSWIWPWGCYGIW